MKNGILVVASALFALLCVPERLDAQGLLEQTRYILAEDTYDAFVSAAETRFPGRFDADAFRRDHPRSAWDTLRTGTGILATSMAYRVGGLRITGAIVQPRSPGPHPILIWARGGVGAAQLDPAQMVEMTWWARQGYVVVASNYRGAGGSEGRDEFGGADVEDIEALVPVARRIAGADPDRLFAIGFSRGGLMLLRAAARGLPVRAFATAGAPTDLAEWSRSRPDILGLLQRMAPDYQAEVANRFCRRSAVCWPRELRVPVLLAHGGSDQAVPVAQAWLLAQSLEGAGRAYELFVFGAADHGLSGRRGDFFRAAHDFFASQAPH